VLPAKGSQMQGSSPEETIPVYNANERTPAIE
jgi:hypothetical protein